MRDTEKIAEAENNQSAAGAEASSDMDLAIRLYEKNINRGIADRNVNYFLA